ncbi:MAG: hypothetical protein ACRDNL_15345, partial [Spirillospora sp.]
PGQRRRERPADPAARAGQQDVRSAQLHAAMMADQCALFIPDRLTPGRCRDGQPLAVPAEMRLLFQPLAPLAPLAPVAPVAPVVPGRGAAVGPGRACRLFWAEVP